MDSSNQSDLFLANNPAVRKLSAKLHLWCGIEMSPEEVGRFLITDMDNDDTFAEAYAETLLNDPGEFAQWAKYLADAESQLRSISEAEYTDRMRIARVGTGVVCLGAAVSGILVQQTEVALAAICLASMAAIIDEVWNAKNSGVVHG